MTRISCLMVTLPVPERRDSRRRAVDAFLAQSHPDRELIVVLDHGPPAERRAVAQEFAALAGRDIRLVLPEERLSLGALRNRSVGAATGDLVCQWDDDDLHHPQRLAEQQAALARSGGTALLLQDVMLLRVEERSLSWLNWAATPCAGHPATLIARRDGLPSYPEEGPASLCDEDVALLERLGGAKSIGHLADRPHLYVYVTHGANHAAAAHHAMLARELAISTGLIRRRAPLLRRSLAPFAFPAAEFRLAGKDGIAATL